jgi:hypothetical protein
MSQTPNQAADACQPVGFSSSSRKVPFVLRLNNKHSRAVEVRNHKGLADSKNTEL